MRSSRLDLKNLSIDNEEELKELLHSYLRRAEDLDVRESKVLKQVELLNSAVASLQAWSESRRFTKPSKGTVLIDVGEIERETKKIKEETSKIQKEVKLKMEENRKLQEEIEKRKMKQKARIAEEVDEDAFIVKYVDDGDDVAEESALKEPMRKEIRSWSPTAPPLEEEREDPAIQFLKEKMRKLKEIEKRQQRESMEERHLIDSRNKHLKNKIEALEALTEVDKRLVSALKGRIRSDGRS